MGMLETYNYEEVIVQYLYSIRTCPFMLMNDDLKVAIAVMALLTLTLVISDFVEDYSSHYGA